MNIISRVVVMLCKIMALFIRTLGMGSGATWPGEIALRLNPAILVQFAAHSKHIVLVAGTNGKTTTVRMIETILTHAGKKVAHNASGANLDNGLISAFITDTGWDGKLRSDYFVFEVDEATLPNVVRKLESYKIHKAREERKFIIVLLNLFRDQLDRYGEADTIAEKWMKVLACHPGFDPGSSFGKMDSGSSTGMTTIINADDPQLAYIGSKLTGHIKYFGLSDPSYYLPNIQHATDSIYCPNCGERLTFRGVYYSHLGDWFCKRCGLIHPKNDLNARDANSPLEGIYNIYNTLAATSVGQSLDISREQISQGLKLFTPAFGRMESLQIDGKLVKILLSKNPTGFNESLRTARNAGAQTFLFVLNDRIPDGRDVSWIWDVDFEVLAGRQVQMFISGDRCYDMGLRIKYAITSSKFKVQSSKFGIEKDLNTAIEMSLKETAAGEALLILPTYSAMLEVRRILIGRKIL